MKINSPKQVIEDWWDSLNKGTRNNLSVFLFALFIFLSIIFAFILSPLVAILLIFIPHKIKEHALKKRLNNIEKAIKNFPNWLFISSIIFLLGVATIYINVDLSQIQSIQDFALKSFQAIFNSAEIIAIVSAVFLYFKEAPARKDQKHYEAFQVINSATGNRMSRARLIALQDLNNDNVSLEAWDLTDSNLENINFFSASLSGAVLVRANLRNANFEFADLDGANLERANFQGANLRGANLKGANFQGANLKKADLRKANLSNVNLKGANLKGANLKGANLEKSKLYSAHLDKADLSNTNLKNADFEGTVLYQTDFEGANFDGTNLASACLIRTNFQRAKNLTPQQLKGLDAPHVCNAKFPDSIPESQVSPNRDCEQSNILYDSKYP